MSFRCAAVRQRLSLGTQVEASPLVKRAGNFLKEKLKDKDYMGGFTTTCRTSFSRLLRRAVSRPPKKSAPAADP